MKATKAARRLAEELSIRLESCGASGKNGHVTVLDVEMQAGAVSHGTDSEGANR